MSLLFVTSLQRGISRHFPHGGLTVGLQSFLSLPAGSKVRACCFLACLLLVHCQSGKFSFSFSKEKWQTQLKEESRMLFLAHLSLSFIIKCQLSGMVFSFTSLPWQMPQPSLSCCCCRGWLYSQCSGYLITPPSYLDPAILFLGQGITSMFAVTGWLHTIWMYASLL